MKEPREPRRVHPVDLLALLLAAAAAVAAYAFLFRRAEPPRPVDPLLGAELEAEFDADLPWKRDWPRTGAMVLLDEYLRADVLEAGAAEDRPGRRRVRLRVRGREDQQAYALTEFRWGIWRGSTIALRDEGRTGDAVSVVSAEVLSVHYPEERP